MKPIILGATLSAAAALAVTVLLGSFWSFLVAQLAVLIIVVVGLSYLIGVGGLLSIASAAFVGIGAYWVVIAGADMGLSYAVTLPTAVVAGWAVGWLLGVITLRLEGFYLAIVTLGFLEVFRILLKQGGDLTGGGYGRVVPIAEFFRKPLSEDVLFALAVFIAGLACTFTYTLIKSRTGRALYALKSHPPAAQLQGVNAWRVKTFAFAYSSALAAVAGAIAAPIRGSTHPAAYTVDESIWHLAIVVVGGLQGSVAGAAVAAGLLFLLPELLRPLAEIREYFTGLVLLGTLILAPRGLGGLFQETRDRVARLAGRSPDRRAATRSGDNETDARSESAGTTDPTEKYRSRA